MLEEAVQDSVPEETQHYDSELRNMLDKYAEQNTRILGLAENAKGMIKVYAGQNTELINLLAEAIRQNIDDQITASAVVAGEKAQEVVDNINKAFQQELDIDSLESLISTIETFGSTQLEIDQLTLERVIERLNIELLIL